MSKLFTPLSLLAAAITLTACALPPAPPPRDTNAMTTSPIQPANPLVGTQWLLATLNGDSPVDGTQATLNFITESRAAGTDGCNRFNGSYTVDGNALSFGPLAGTMMACPPDIMTQAYAFNNALAATRTFAIANDTLTLSDASGTAVAGTKWNVTNINNGRQAVVGLIDGVALTVDFGTDGQVSGSAGCNNYFGSFTQGEGTIAVGPLASTQKLCPEPAGVMDQEAQFLKALESAATYHLDGDKLDLRTKDDALAVVMRRAP